MSTKTLTPAELARREKQKAAQAAAKLRQAAGAPTKKERKKRKRDVAAGVAPEPKKPNNSGAKASSGGGAAWRKRDGYESNIKVKDVSSVRRGAIYHVLRDKLGMDKIPDDVEENPELDANHEEEADSAVKKWNALSNAPRLAATRPKPPKLKIDVHAKPSNKKTTFGDDDLDDTQRLGGDGADSDSDSDGDAAPDQPGAELDSFSEIDENDDVSELMPRNEEAELAILNDFVEALIDGAPGRADAQAPAAAAALVEAHARDDAARRDRHDAVVRVVAAAARARRWRQVRARRRAPLYGFVPPELLKPSPAKARPLNRRVDVTVRDGDAFRFAEVTVLARGGGGGADPAPGEGGQLENALKEISHAPEHVLRYGRGSSLGMHPSLSKSESETSDAGQDKGDSTSDAGGWGFYKDCEGTPGDSAYRLDATALSNRETPDYVLEDSLANQALWHSTAGCRPAQPAHERRQFEELWAQNLANSQASGGEARSDSNSKRRRALACDRAPVEVGGAQLLLRASSPFGTSVTKSWRCDCCGELTSIMIRIPKYQIVRKGGKSHAEYLVVARLGAVTFGLWRRFAHFTALHDKISKTLDKDDYQNTLWSWRCLRRRQRWFRCLDRDYLALKCFLLERFLHDAVFESASSTLFADFLEITLAQP
ncbi:hypothetical protein SO694_00020320 [Aureococcus anophagefferens]|uniref:PX domain-containing protein n=1 Tax=Aureococcus anophagefferens TaxID=44056 RepID=A0ABR1FU36_AURAN